MSLYHLIHRPFVGPTLFPLNMLREREPALFDGQKEKYKGRESLLEYKLKTLGCLWNDVIHLSAVHPRDIFDALEEAGYRRLQKRSPYFFVIDPAALEPEKTVFFHPDTQEEEDYDAKRVEEFSALPEKMKNYYRKELAEGRRPFLWHHITHILYKGTIDVATLHIVDKRGCLLEEKAKLFEDG